MSCGNRTFLLLPDKTDLKVFEQHFHIYRLGISKKEIPEISKEQQVDRPYLIIVENLQYYFLEKGIPWLRFLCFLSAADTVIGLYKSLHLGLKNPIYWKLNCCFDSMYLVADSYKSNELIKCNYYLFSRESLLSSVKAWVLFKTFFSNESECLIICQNRYLFAWGEQSLNQLKVIRLSELENFDLSVIKRVLFLTFELNCEDRDWILRNCCADSRIQTMDIFSVNGNFLRWYERVYNKAIVALKTFCLRSLI